MDGLEQLSDAELRLRLMQCGFPAMPVTSTTRKILIKKLRHHITSEKQKIHRASSTTSRYSSGEESDGGGIGLKSDASQRKTIGAVGGVSSGKSKTGGSPRLGRSQRATLAAAAAAAGGGLPPLATNSLSMPPPVATASMRSTVAKRNSSISSSSPAAAAAAPFVAGTNGGGSHGNSINHIGAGSSSKLSLSPPTSSSIYVSPVIVHDSEEEDYPPSMRPGAASASRGFGSVSSPPPASHSSLFRKNITPPSANSSMYSNLNTSLGAGAGGGGGGGGAGSNNSSGLLNDSNGSSNGPSDSSPYISEYTKRLMQLRGETVSQENYNSAILGAMGRRSTNTGVVAPSVPSISSRYGGGGPSGQSFPSRPQQPTGAPMMGAGLSVLHRPGYLRNSGHHPLSSKGAAKGSSSSPLAPSGSVIAGNHIRQWYNRFQLGGGGAASGGAGGSGGTSGGSQYEFNENDIVTHAQPSPDPPSIPFRAAIGNLITRLDEHYGFKQTFIPCALLCLLVAFLVSVAFMYMTISTDLASTLSSIDTRYDVCEEGRGIPGTTCVHPADIEPALELLKLIGSELKTRVEQHHCRSNAASVSGLMSAGEALKYAKEHSPSVLIPQLTRYLHAMEYLIDRNPQWRIDHCNADGEPIAFAQVLERRATKSNHFTILKPKLPFTCMLYNKFQKFFVIVGCLALAGIVFLLGSYFFRFVMQVKQKRREQVNGLISEIIHAVSQAAANASDAVASANTSGKEPDPRVVINHLRERLLGPANRRKLGWAWDEALHFIEHNESRIQFEVASIGGDDFRMMRWIDSAPLATSLPGAGAGGRAGEGATGGGGSLAASSGSGVCPKKWQSPAFDNSNKIHDPPTPCLKIRQMFDKYEVNDPNLKTIVQDAILEKVGGRCKIYDIQLDRSSCCVYVRCASNKDAGIVHDEINGWWFDNRLVSIKFLRLERYLQRFPRSLAGPACLKPSNKNNSSMSHQLALHNNSGPGGGDRGAGAYNNGSRSTNHELDTDPEEDDEGEEEEDEEEEEVEEELVAAAAAAAQRSSLMGRNRRSGSVLNGRRVTRLGGDELDGREDQEN